MGQYSIKELEQLSGIKAHTIRIWEKRHKVIQPLRTPTNIRFYSDDDLKKIISIAVLNNNGIKISHILRLSNDELSKKIAELSDEKKDTGIFIDQLVLAMIDLKEELFERTIGKLIKQIGFEATITDVVYPFLEKIGVLWHTGIINPAQEHFISQLVRQKILVAIDALDYPQQDAASAVLFLPENELHEIGLLFYHYLIRKSGYKTFYLGQTVPYNDVKFVCNLQKPAYIVSSITTYLSAAQVQSYLSTLASDFPDSRILLAGGVIRKLDLTLQPNVTIFEGVPALKKLLKIA